MVRPAALPLPRLPRMPLPSRRAGVVALLTLVALVPAGLWLRDSSLVRVQNVEVTGASGADAAAIRRALTAAAGDMTTLHVRTADLRAAVAAYPVVRDVHVETQLPDTLRVTVREHVPVAALASGSRRVAVAADGTILASSSAAELPLVDVPNLPGGRRLTDLRALRTAALLGAAPQALRRRVARAEVTANGLTAYLARGPEVYFGTPARLEAKWAAVAAVLADESSRGMRYLDVRVPERPAAGGLEPLNPRPEVQTPVTP